MSRREMDWAGLRPRDSISVPDISSIPLLFLFDLTWTLIFEFDVAWHSEGGIVP
jgi:hypothetical protein